MSLCTMRKILDALKKVAAPKKRAVVTEELTSDVCTNCENSGKECRSCGFGTEPVV